MHLWKTAGAADTPNGNQNKPLWVLIVTNSLEFSSIGTCKYACDMSSFEKYFTPDKAANKSSTPGSEYASTLAALVTL